MLVFGYPISSVGFVVSQLTAAVARRNVMGCQFHPEKSGDVGLAILKTFCEGSW